jgi:16S rRNA (guanine527-N7)-methyltransferase
LVTPRELLTSGAKELGVPLSVEQADKVFIYLQELKKWNRKINLTAISDDRDAVIKHVLDSLSYIKGFHPSEETRLLDMGSGAGFPAIPIKIAFPAVSITLVESIKKKASFLRHIIRTLKLTGTEVRDMRTEELPDSDTAVYNVVTARAFAEIARALAAASLLLTPEGIVVLSRGAGETASEKDTDRAGFILEKRMELTLPHSDYSRAIWVFRKKK